MNFSAIFGIFLAVIVMVGSILMSPGNNRLFLDMHAFVIVLGGTLAASLLSFSGKKLYVLVKIFFKTALGKNDEIHIALSELVDLAKDFVKTITI
ncbi:MAG TPA: hypothetical protein PLJ21_07840 [Pseudobdellovibrionaceae bacterium]|nr:hypothetical protein [Pseudobdellovibrionaceae bacterium]